MEYLFSFFHGFIVSSICALLAFSLRIISLSGLIGGIIFGTIIYGCTGWQGFVVPLAFVAIGSMCTLIGYKKKAEMGIAQEEGGKRGAKHALANILAGTIFAAASLFFSAEYRVLFMVAMAGSFATAAADTASSEMGQLFGRTPINPITFKRVKPGTEGAVSIEGTSFGIVASMVIALVGVSSGVFVQRLCLKNVKMFDFRPINLPAFISIVAGAFIGNMVESVVGAIGGKKLNNELLNFMNTLVGGLASGLIMYAFIKNILAHPS